LKYPLTDARAKPESTITITTAARRVIFDTTIEIVERLMGGWLEIDVMIVSIHGRL
jgi:hypothetical protein